jgi:hypothetical protein
LARFQNVSLFYFKKKPKNVQTLQAAALNELLQRSVGRAEISVGWCKKRVGNIFRRTEN